MKNNVIIFLTTALCTFAWLHRNCQRDMDRMFDRLKAQEAINQQMQTEAINARIRMMMTNR